MNWLLVRKSEHLVYALLLLTIGLMAGFDALGDFSQGASAKHIIFELIMSISALIGASILWIRFRKVKIHLSETNRRLKETLESAKQWQTQHSDLVKGLSAAIDRQFVSWKLSPSEKEVALLLLKGLSLKQIAELRNTSERTVRQQSLSVYAKAELKGRAELSAFFLEDLLLPN